jgi:hypothetical protein
LKKLKEYFNELGYETVRTARPEEYRIVFEDKEGTHVDVFLDKLSMCHTIDLRDRLTVDSPTIPLSDIVLEKFRYFVYALKRRGNERMMEVGDEGDEHGVGEQFADRAEIAVFAQQPVVGVGAVTCTMSLIQLAFISCAALSYNTLSLILNTMLVLSHTFPTT